MSEYVPERTPGRRATDRTTSEMMKQIVINNAIQTTQGEVIELLKQMCVVKQDKIKALEGIRETLNRRIEELERKNGNGKCN